MINTLANGTPEEKNNSLYQQNEGIFQDKITPFSLSELSSFVFPKDSIHK
jgi:hypothetical protein